VRPVAGVVFRASARRTPRRGRGGCEYLGGGSVDHGRRTLDCVLAGAPATLAALRPLLGTRA